MRTKISLAAVLLFNVSTPALAQTAPATDAAAVVTSDAAVAVAQADAPFPEAWFEIFRLAPGKHEEFVRRIGQADEVSKAGGQPPIQLYFHSEGAEWDVLLLKPVTGQKPTAAQEAAMAAKAKELRMPSGPAYFIYIRELVASHTDTKAYGPVSAAQWLAKLDKWRLENPAPTKDAK
ncbi:MAG: hypothetical protein EOP62_04885 [Sphingomonadales bacterium]|nr:MAG: hypothetical protein EOP62_04885 [Sphingomonadales bacterium]